MAQQYPGASMAYGFGQQVPAPSASYLAAPTYGSSPSASPPLSQQAPPQNKAGGSMQSPPTPMQWLRTHWIAVAAVSLAAVTFCVAIAGLAMSMHHHVFNKAQPPAPKKMFAITSPVYDLGGSSMQQHTIRQMLFNNTGRAALRIWMGNFNHKTDVPATHVYNTGYINAFFTDSKLDMWCDGSTVADPGTCSDTGMPEELITLVASGCAAAMGRQLGASGTLYRLTEKGWIRNPKTDDMPPMQKLVHTSSCYDVPTKLSPASEVF